MASLDSLRDYWDKLSDRERRLIGSMSGVAFVMVAFVVVWLTSSALADIEEERDALRSVLQQIDRSSGELAVRMAQRQATEALYEHRMPPLGSFLETKAKEAALEVRQVVEQPEKEVDGYRRQQVRVSFSNVSLRGLVHFLTSIKQEQLPIAIERLHIEHYQAGDVFNSQIGIVAFDAKAKGKGKKGDESKAQAKDQEKAE